MANVGVNRIAGRGTMTVADWKPPKQVSADLILARKALDQHRRDEAERHLRRALDDNPDLAETRALMGLLHESLGEHHAAYQCYRLATPARPPRHHRGRRPAAATANASVTMPRIPRSILAPTSSHEITGHARRRRGRCRGPPGHGTFVAWDSPAAGNIALATMGDEEMAQAIPVNPRCEVGQEQPDGTMQVAPDLSYQRLLLVNVAYYGPPDAGPGGWVLVDAGVYGTYHTILGAAEKRFGAGSKPAAIVMTHGHFDHVGALEISPSTGTCRSTRTSWSCHTSTVGRRIPRRTRRSEEG